MTIGEKIKRLRQEKGMTQEELGKAIGVQKAAINKYELGIVVNLKKEKISQLAKALDVNPVWLMDDDETWPPMPSTRSLIAKAIEENRKREEAEDQEIDEIVDLYMSLSTEGRNNAKKYLLFLKGTEAR